MNLGFQCCFPSAPACNPCFVPCARIACQPHCSPPPGAFASKAQNVLLLAFTDQVVCWSCYHMPLRKPEYWRGATSLMLPTLRWPHCQGEPSTRKLYIPQERRGRYPKERRLAAHSPCTTTSSTNVCMYKLRGMGRQSQLNVSFLV